MRRGGIVVSEYGSSYRGYTSTIGRQLPFGKQDTQTLDLYGVVRRGGDAYIRTVRDGVPAVAAHAAARQVIVEAGLEPHRVHTTGYGLAPGFPPSWGEPLHMLDASPYTIRAGMVLTIEPPVFIGAERRGVRIIDNVLVTPTGRSEEPTSELRH